jgi:uncharacterized membrane protein YgcG
MPVLVLLDPALGAAAALLRQVLGPAFWVAVGSLPAGAAWPERYVVVATAADPALVARLRHDFPRADLLVVTGAATPEHDPPLVAGILAAGADDVLTSMSVPELAAWVRGRRLTAGQNQPAAPAGSRPSPRPRPGSRPSGRQQVLARLSSAKRSLAVAAVAGFTALIGMVGWAGARGSSTPDATNGGGQASVHRQVTPQGPDGFFGGGGSYGFGGGSGDQSGPAAGSSGAS